MERESENKTLHYTPLDRGLGPVERSYKSIPNIPAKSVQDVAQWSRKTSANAGIRPNAGVNWIGIPTQPSISSMQHTTFWPGRGQLRRSLRSLTGGTFTNGG
jgi:hypothetical protein